MKKIFAAAMAMALSLSMVACSSSEPAASSPAASSPAASSTETAITTIEAGKLIMSTNAQFPPYEMVADGEGVEGSGFEGIDIELAHALAAKLGMELVIDDMEFDSSLMAVQEGRSDLVLAGLTYTEGAISDEELAEAMATAFDGSCHGSVALLATKNPRELVRIVLLGRDTPHDDDAPLGEETEGDGDAG